MHFKKIDWQWRILGQELIVFGLIQILGLATAFRLLSQKIFVEAKVTISFWDFVFAFILAIFLMLLLLRFVKGSSIFKIIFSLTIFLGVQLILDAFMPTIFSVSLAILIVFFQFITPQVWLHNLAIVLGVSGIGVALGLSMPVTAVLLILFVLSLYDYIAVYKTHYMVSMFQELLKRGTIFAVIFPRKVAGWLADLTKVKPGTQFLFLGTGDLVLPLVFAASAISYGVESVFWVVFGGLVGVIILHILFVSQPKKFPMPALPPIAFFSVLGFLISLLIR